MSKAVRMIAIVMVCLSMIGCARVDRAETNSTSRFVTLETTSKWRVVADKETGVMYAVSTGVYSNGTFTLLVDADGNPLVWEGEDRG